MTTINEFFLSRPALTAGLINHLWQSSVVGLVLLALLAFAGRRSARTRQGIAWLALAKFVLPVSFVVSLVARWGGQGKFGGLPQPLTLPLTLPAMVVRANAADPAAGGFWAHSFWSLAVMLWSAGFLGLVGLWAFRGQRLQRRLLAGAAALSGAPLQGALAAARRMGLAAPPPCLSVAAGFGPGVLGVFSPRVILPCGIEDRLLPDELEAILVHEFVHVRRRDSWWKFVQMLLVSAFWFNPVVWLLQRRLNIEVEKSCDERVLAITAAPESYARGIVKTLRFSLGLPQIGFASAVTPPVTARLKAILTSAPRRERPLGRAALFGVGGLLLALSGYAGSVEAGAAPGVLPVPSDPRLYAVGEIDQQPVATYQPRPLYPFAMKQQGLAGEVVVGFTLDTHGRVQNPAVLSSTQHEFEAAALDAVGHWRFRAGRKDGTAVNVYLRVPIVFSLDRQGVIPAKPSAAVVAAAPLPAALAASIPAASAAPVAPVQPRLAERTVPPPAAILPVPAVSAAPASARTVIRTTARPAVLIAAATAAPAGDGAGIFEPSMLDVQPKPIKQPRPHYPFAMKKQWISGEVVVGFIVDATGAVISAHAIRSTRAEFESEAVGAVAQWHFKPGKKGGAAVSTRMQVPIVFTLKNED